MKILTIIVTYNGIPWIDRCLGSLMDSDNPTDIYVLDNGSTDGTQVYIRSHFPTVLFKQNEGNLGFAKANNIGLRYALDNEYDYVFLLNQDAWLGSRDTLSNLITVAESVPDVGVISPIQLYADGNLCREFIYNSSVAFVSDLFSGGMKSYYDFAQVGACSWLIPKKCLTIVGGFDTILFSHYGEDFNYCQRVHYHKLKVYITPTCAIHHDMKDRDDRTYIGAKIWESKNKNLSGKLQLGDINMNVNLLRYFIIEVVKTIAFFFSFQFSSANNHFQNLLLIKPICLSREVNKRVGATHL